ncbi:uncharacterized protein LOC123586555 [Leopardus geoffroyi]|uniref:uncharacterized protein LOC123586555 n=1 Tax=Leopardus geoffroyi TaxID=46844 RepID=UPI001E25FA30|nr:uncharacterized protein LOC123586555 [Leopardus geoffroyi]
MPPGHTAVPFRETQNVTPVKSFEKYDCKFAKHCVTHHTHYLNRFSWKPHDPPRDPCRRAGASQSRRRRAGAGIRPAFPGPRPPPLLQFRVLSVGAAAVWTAAKAAKLRGPGFQPGLFPGRAPAWLPPGTLRVGTVPRCRVPDGPWRLCSPSLPQATPADMFAKAFRVKSNTAIKGSDRRKLRADVMAAFPTLGTDQVSVLVPGKEELNIVKLYAHRGDAVTVYVSGGNPILFEVEKNLYPTAFTTWPPVLEKLVGGADLMLPGLVVSPAGLPQVQKGDLCAIALLGNRVAAPVCILTNIARGFPSLHIFTNTCCFCVVYVSHSDRCAVIRHCSFELYFPDVERCRASFYVSVSHLDVFSGKRRIHVFCPLLNWIICCLGVKFISCCWVLSSLYVLNTNLMKF